VEVIDTIKTIRSIRRYRSDAVPKEELSIILEAARWAPSWANTQCWRIVIVRNGDKRAMLAGTVPDWNPSRLAVSEAPVIIVICAELGKSGFHKGKASTDKGDWYMFDVALAAHNLTLAAHSLGLGTVHIGVFDAKKAASILELPENIVVVELIPLGYPAEEPKIPLRREISEFVWFID